jgi:hypothetical protein
VKKPWVDLEHDGKAKVPADAARAGSMAGLEARQSIGSVFSNWSAEHLGRRKLILLTTVEEQFMRELLRIPLLRLFILNGAMGVAFGIAIGAALFALDFRGVGTLAWRTEGGFLALAMVCAGLSVTCGSAAIATAVMLLPERAEDDSGYGHMSEQPDREMLRRSQVADVTESQSDERSVAPHKIPVIPKDRPAPKADANRDT